MVVSAPKSPSSNRDAARPEHEIVLVGGGLASGLTALAILKRRPDARLALVEREARLAGNHTWCVHDDALTEAARDLIEPLVVRRWDDHEVRFPEISRILEASYACVTSERLSQRVHEAFAAAPNATLVLGAEATAIEPHAVRLADGRTLSARVVLDARGPGTLPVDAHTGYQKFVGLELVLAQPHGIERPILMDAAGPQLDGFRFLYVLPFAEDRVLIEDTCFSTNPSLNAAGYRERVLAYAAARGLFIRDVVRQESGVLPMPWAAETPRPNGSPLRIGYGGGWFHPATGYSLPIAVRVATTIAEVEPAGIAAALAVLRDQHEAQARYARLLNALLFRCFEPGSMRNVFERFYGLPEPLIGRFYDLTLSRADRARILLGRPPRGISMRAAVALLGGVS